MLANQYLWDENQTRYQLVRSNGDISRAYNWLFIPGGPGADSSYFSDLIAGLEVPGNFWRIDFPGNGTNISDDIPAENNFAAWESHLLTAVKIFENPIVIGHSFGAMLALQNPALRDQLRALILMNSQPDYPTEDSMQLADEKGLPPIDKEMQAFMENPGDETARALLIACAPYYFTKQNRERGRQLLRDLPFAYRPAAWFFSVALAQRYDAKWVPDNLPVLVIGGAEDCITPFSTYTKNQKFQRDNISLNCIQDAGHLPWLENMDAVNKLFNRFFDECLK